MIHGHPVVDIKAHSNYLPPQNMMALNSVYMNFGMPYNFHWPIKYYWK